MNNSLLPTLLLLAAAPALAQTAGGLELDGACRVDQRRAPPDARGDVRRARREG